MPTKKRRQRKLLLPAYYNVRISDWDWSYSFSVNVPRYDDERQLADYRHLLVRGTLLRPRRIAVESVELIFLPNVGPRELERQHDKPPPRAVGSLNIQGKTLSGYLSMPTDALGPVMQMLMPGVLKYVLLDGEPMRYRKALIRRYEIAGHYNDEDYPDE